MPISLQRHRVMLTRVRNVITQAYLAATLSGHAPSRAKSYRRCPSRLSIIAPGPAGVRNVVAHAHLVAISSGHALFVCGTPSRLPISLQRDRIMPNCVLSAVAKLLGPPNRRLQRTALCALKIVAILKRGFGPTVFSISNAPPLKRKTLGAYQTSYIHEVLYG